jgi:hypothetical protein
MTVLIRFVKNTGVKIGAAIKVFGPLGITTPVDLDTAIAKRYVSAGLAARVDAEPDDEAPDEEGGSGSGEGDANPATTKPDYGEDMKRSDLDALLIAVGLEPSDYSSKQKAIAALDAHYADLPNLAD